MTFSQLIFSKTMDDDLCFKCGSPVLNKAYGIYCSSTCQQNTKEEISEQIKSTLEPRRESVEKSEELTGVPVLRKKDGEIDGRSKQAVATRNVLDKNDQVRRASLKSDPEPRDDYPDGKA